MNKLSMTLVCLVIFLALGLLTFFYYIKPQREYIKASTQSCLNKAMSPINSEVAKYSSNTYKTAAGFNELLKTQDTEITKCLDSYNTILFSPSEKSLINLDLNLKLDKQKADISSYTKRVEERISEQKQEQNKQNSCQKRKVVFDKYEACIEDRKVNDPNYWSEVSSFALDDSKNPCLKQYNYKQIQVDSFTCIMMGIVTP